MAGEKFRPRPRSVPHFHINLLPDARRVSTTRALMSAYLNYLYRFGERHVYGQIVTFEAGGAKSYSSATALRS